MSGSLGNGTVLKRNDIAVAGITKIDPPEITQEAVDSSVLDSADDYDEFVGGSLNGGEVGIEGNIVAASTAVTDLLSDLNGHVVQDFTIEFPSGATWDFTALVTKFKPGTVVKNGLLSYTASLKVSGKPVFDDGVV